MLSIKEIKTNIYEINNKSYFVYGRDLLNTAVPQNQDNILLMLDPLFLSCFKEDAIKVIESGKKEITVLFLLFDEMKAEQVFEYITTLTELVFEFKKNNVKINFLTTTELEITYADSSYYHFWNYNYAPIVLSFETEYTNMMKDEGEINVK